jgi:hypothetical protein
MNRHCEAPLRRGNPELPPTHNRLYDTANESVSKAPPIILQNQAKQFFFAKKRTKKPLRIKTIL